MSAVVIADLHVSSNPRDDYRKNFLRGFVKQVRMHKVDQVIILGDLTEEKDRHDAALVNFIVDFIADLAKASYVIVLRGNHDYVDIRYPFFEFLRHLKGCDFISEPTNIALGRTGSSLFLPHSRDPVKDWRGVIDARPDFIFAHNTFAGADVGHGIVIEGGAPVSIFPKGVRVISGDVHVPQKLGCVTYVGAPYTIDFGDDYLPRYLLIEDYTPRYMLKEDASLSAVGHVNSIRCNGPQKRLIETGSVTRLADARVRKGDIVKVRITISQEQRAKWAEIQQSIRDWGNGAGVIVHSIVPVVAGTQDAQRIKKDGKPAHIKGDKEIVRQFADDRDVDDHTLKTGLTIMDNDK